MLKVFPSVSSEVHKRLSRRIQAKAWVSKGCHKQYSTWSQSKTLFHPSTLLILPYMKVIAVKTIPAWFIHLQSRELESVSPCPWPLTPYLSIQFKQLHFNLHWWEAPRQRQLRDPWTSWCWTQIHLYNGDKQKEHPVPFQKEFHRLELKCKTGFNWIVTKTHPWYQLLINVRLKSWSVHVCSCASLSRAPRTSYPVCSHFSISWKVPSYKVMCACVIEPFIHFALKRNWICTCASSRQHKCALKHTNPVKCGGLAL